MTPNPDRLRWLVADPEMLGVLLAVDTLAIDTHTLTPDQVERATDACELDAIPADVLGQAVNLADLLADGLRWRAYMATPWASGGTRGTSRSFLDMVACPASDLAGEPYLWIDPRTAAVVPWDVLGDPRPYALVCPEHEAEVTR